MALRKRIGKLGVSLTVALAVMAGGAFCFAPTKVYADEQTLPAAYQIDISPFVVGDQGGLSSKLCWSYASSKMLETYIYNNFAPQTAFNISEEWISLAYMFYVRDAANQDKWLTGEDDYAKDNLTYEFRQDGILHFLERVVNTYGIMTEEDYDYQGEITLGNYQEVFNNYKDKAKTDIIENLKFSCIQNYPGVKTGTGENLYTQESILNAMKTYLSSQTLANSAIYTGVGEISGKGTETPYVWHDVTGNLTHAMTIVGYDDNKVVTVDGGQQKTGAFILLNSYGENNKIVYMPYDMFMPNLQEDGSNIYELNNVIPNTFYVSGGVPATGDSGTGSEGSGENTGGTGTEGEGTGSGENAGAGEGEGGTEEGGEVIPEGTLSFWESIMAKTPEEKVFMGVAVGVVVIFLFVGLGFLIAAAARRRQTKSINQQVLAHNFAKYQSHRLNLEKQKKELDEELQKIREEQKRKKQRRLKRQFNKNLNTGGSGGNNDNINL